MKKYKIKGKRTSLVIISLFLIIFSLAFSTISADSQIGYEHTDNFLHTWNQNPLGEAEANIWQNVNSNYMQFFNGKNITDAIERSGWVNFVFGLGYYQGGSFKTFESDVLSNPIVIIESDNSTYWNQSVYKSEALWGAGWNREQSLNDLFMENTFWWDTNFESPHQLYYVWKFKDINILNDNSDDIFRYCYDEIISNESVTRHCPEVAIDSTSSFEENIVDSFQIIDSKTKVGHYITWDENDNIILRYDGDGEPMLLRKIENLQGYDEIKYNWIDAGQPICENGLDADGSAIMCNYHNESGSGYIYYYATLMSSGYLAYIDVNLKIGERRVVSNSTEYRGYYLFDTNTSGIPEGSNITAVSIWHGVPPVPFATGTVSDWRSGFYTCGDDCIMDDGGINNTETEFNDGNYTTLIDWDDDTGKHSPICGGNEPCESLIMLGDDVNDIAVKDFQEAFDNNRFYSVVIRDASLWSSDEEWWHLSDGVDSNGADSTNMTYLKINFTAPDYVYNETEARDAISEGINNTIPTATQYQDQQIYTVTLNNTQTTGYFDFIAILNNQTWAFNYLTGSDSYTNVNSLSYIVNVWENEKLNYDEIVTQVESLINDTKI
ncbi:MAG: hypothetical protein ABIH25_03865 [Candidatus Woesearchaeota archaeon]